MKSQSEIKEMIDKASDDERNLHGMTYQEGVRAALEWVLENWDEDPIED